MHPLLSWAVMWLLFSMAASAVAGTLYVSPSGDDTHPGTLAQPWRTIQKAANSAKPGNKVYVRGGVYREKVNIGISGTVRQGFISFLNYPGERPIVDGTGLTVPAEESGLIFITDRSFIKIAGFELRNLKTTVSGRVPVGIHVRGAAHHITLSSNTIHHIEHNRQADHDVDAHGIAVYGDNAAKPVHHLVISNNHLHHLTLGSSEALVVNGNVSYFSITNNTVHDSNNIGIDAIGFEKVSADPASDQARNGLIAGNHVYNIDARGNPAYGNDPSADGIYIDGGRNIIVERNIVHHNNIGIELASEHAGRSTRDIIVRNNFVYLNDVVGITLGGYNKQRGSTENCVIVNNTLFQNDQLKWGNGELLLQYDTRNNLIKNNIFYSNKQNLLISNPFIENYANQVDANIFFTPSGNAKNAEWQWQRKYYLGFDHYVASTGNDSQSLFIDPLLTGIEQAPDLHIQADSPAINQGEALDAGTVDIDGQPRVNGLPDIGADER